MGYSYTVSLFHIGVVSPFFMALGLDKLPFRWRKFLVILSAIIFLYHSYKLWVTYKYKEKLKKKRNSFIVSI